MRKRLLFRDVSVGDTFAFVLSGEDTGWPRVKDSPTEYEFSDPPDGDTNTCSADGSQLVSQDV